MHAPKFCDLQARFSSAECGSVAVERCSVRNPPPGSNAELVLNYLAGFGSVPSCTGEVATAISALQDEDDLVAFWCVEGLAVSSASDGWWVLFEGIPDGI